MVAGHDMEDPLADRLDDAGAFMAEHDRTRRADTAAAMDAQIGVADARSDDPHQHLAGAGALEFSSISEPRRSASPSRDTAAVATFTCAPGPDGWRANWWCPT